MDAAELRWRDAMSGAKMIPLNGPALEVLANAVQIEGNPYVIVGAGEGAHLTDLRKPWRRVRKAAGLEDVRIHDLRQLLALAGTIRGVPQPDRACSPWSGIR